MWGLSHDCDGISRIMKLRQFPTADMIPAMILVMPISWAWVNWILPFLG
ncbi:protein of unknown function [Streptococcus thermophilus]|nr:Integral membrane protein [Streptococcus thermophilus]UTS68515.1 Putative inner membrane protein [Streptococcus thermophilus]CAD0120486.1 protein of unknown function [Streptococcus thermophilus]CAD0124760.1 protein of unknown function [Streptococcus thermophilus]CAD0125502.1 protein of unknown function [Streptococcus thermophilus]